MKKNITIKRKGRFRTFIQLGVFSILFVGLVGQKSYGQYTVDGAISDRFQQTEMIQLDNIFVSVDFENTPLDEAILQLGRQSGINFNYNSSLMPEDLRVTYQAKNTSLQEVLDSLIPENIQHVIVRNMVIFQEKSMETNLGQPAIAQEEVRGIVTDAETGETLPGTNVVVKGTTTGGVTNSEGEFAFLVPSLNDTLVFSYIGYQTIEEPLNGRNSLYIQMEHDETHELGDLVVVGFGVQEQISVTGSVSTIPVQDLQQTSTPSLSNTLGGRIPGVVTRQASGEPGYDAATINIRGLGTWSNRAPLVLVDGIERDMNSINAQEVESFSILKDASATAVYGVRGANGVILINTKRGSVGSPTITYRSEAAMLSAMRLPNYIGGPEYANLVNEAWLNVGGSPQYSEEELEMFRTGADPYLYPNVDWVDEVLKRNTYQAINNLSISGGTSMVRYYTNVGYTIQNGIYNEDPGNPYSTNARVERYNFRSNVDISLSENLTMELGLGGIIQHGNYPGTSAPGIFNSLRIISPIQYPVFNPDGSLGGGLSYLGENPYGQATQSGYSVQDRNTLQGTFGGRWDLSSLVTEGLFVQGRFAYDHYYFAATERYKAYALRQYVGMDDDGNHLYNNIREEQPLGFHINNHGNRAIYGEASLNYNHDFGRHSFTGLVLFNRREYVELVQPGLTSTGNLPYRSQGLAGRLTYGFDDRYLLEFNVGYNGSENFPKGNRYGFFPSVSAGWIVSGERFWNVHAINHLKFRGSYGQVGNDRIGQRFIFNTTINRSGQSYMFSPNMTWSQGFDEALIGNPNVTWEVSTKTNLGIDLEMFDSRITLQVDAFHENREGILLQRGDVPQVVGLYPWVVPYANLGEVENRGVDSQLEIRNNTSSGFFYSLRGTFTFARNKVIYNDEPTPVHSYLATEGQRIDQPFGLIALGLFRDQEEIDESPVQTFMTTVRPGDIKYKDINGDGVIDTYDRVPIGHPRTPEIMYGFGGTIGYKAFEISAFFNGVANTSLFIDGPSMYPFQLGVGSYNVMQEYYDNRWTPDNPDAQYPGVITAENPNNYRTSTLYMQDASYLRLKTAEIAYNVPEFFTSRIGISGTRLFINGTNLLTWDKIKVIDPESNYGTGGYPLQRTFNFGLELTF